MQKRELRRSVDCRYVATDKGCEDHFARVSATLCRIQQTNIVIGPVEKLSISHVGTDSGIDVKITCTECPKAKVLVKVCANAIQNGRPVAEKTNNVTRFYPKGHHGLGEGNFKQEWAMAEAAGDEDEAPMSDAPAPPEPELIATPPAAASAPLMSNVERCIALRLIIRRWTALTPPKHCHVHPISASLSVVSRVGCLVCLAHARVSTSSTS